MGGAHGQARDRVAAAAAAAGIWVPPPVDASLRLPLLLAHLHSRETLPRLLPRCRASCKARSPSCGTCAAWSCLCGRSATAWRSGTSRAATRPSSRACGHTSSVRRGSGPRTRSTTSSSAARPSTRLQGRSRPPCPRPPCLRPPRRPGQRRRRRLTPQPPPLPPSLLLSISLPLSLAWIFHHFTHFIEMYYSECDKMIMMPLFYNIISCLDYVPG